MAEFKKRVYSKKKLFVRRSNHRNNKFDIKKIKTEQGPVKIKIMTPQFVRTSTCLNIRMD